MANRDHVGLLKRTQLMRNTEIWNRWRKEHPSVEPELRALKLVGAHLTSVNLSKANLPEAKLGWANLKDADLSHSNLRGANLSGANLKGANLQRANLHKANLQGANLRGADLSRAFLNTVKLAGAILPDGRFWTREIDMRRYSDPEHPQFWQVDKIRN